MRSSKTVISLCLVKKKRKKGKINEGMREIEREDAVLFNKPLEKTKQNLFLFSVYYIIVIISYILFLQRRYNISYVYITISKTRYTTNCISLYHITMI